MSGTQSKEPWVTSISAISEAMKSMQSKQRAKSSSLTSLLDIPHISKTLDRFVIETVANSSRHWNSLIAYKACGILALVVTFSMLVVSRYIFGYTQCNVTHAPAYSCSYSTISLPPPRKSKCMEYGVVSRPSRKSSLCSP